MRGDSDLLTPAEAAVVATVTVRDVNRAIDEKILPEQFYSLEGGRRLHVSACPMVGFYFHAAKELTAEERSFVIQQLSDKMGGGSIVHSGVDDRERSSSTYWIVHHDFLTVNLWRFAVNAQERYAKLSEARQMVDEDPDILGGMPVIRGTRIPVNDIAASVKAGVSHAEIRDAYPNLDDNQIDLAVIYSEATPQRGRPRRLEPPHGTKVVQRRRK